MFQNIVGLMEKHYQNGSIGKPSIKNLLGLMDNIPAHSFHAIVDVGLVFLRVLFNNLSVNEELISNEILTKKGTGIEKFLPLRH